MKATKSKDGKLTIKVKKGKPSDEKDEKDEIPAKEKQEAFMMNAKKFTK